MICCQGGGLPFWTDSRVQRPLSPLVGPNMIDRRYRVTSGILPERLLVSTNSQDGDKYYVWLLAGSQSHPVYVSQDETSIRTERCVKSLIFKVTFDAVNQSDIHTD